MRVPRSTDRRVVRTREALRDALIALMVERGWDEVGIRDVCARASVGRSTFYTHFADKEELLLSGYDDLRRMLRSVGRGESRKPLAFTRGLLEHAHDNKRMFRALVGKRSSQVAQTRFLQLVVELTREDLAGNGETTVQYVAGAFFQLLIWWVDSRSALSPEEIDAIFQRLTKPVLAEARLAR